MNKNLKELFYSRKRKVTFSYDGMDATFVLMAPSAQTRETALQEAQYEQARVAKILLKEAENLKALYLLQEQDMLLDALLDTEEESMRNQAMLTLISDAPDFAEKLADKVIKLRTIRKEELKTIEKEKIVDQLVQHDITVQLNAVLLNTASNVLLAQVLCDESGKQLFDSVGEMKAILPAEVMEQLYDAFLEFLTERGNAQVFLKPHTSSV